MIKNFSVIVFDLGNVQLPFDYDILINRLNDVDDNLGTKFMDFYKNNYNIHRQFESGKLSEEEFIKIMLNALEDKIDAETFCKIYSGVFSVNEDVVSLLPKLKEKYTLVLLSNTNSIHRKYGWDHYDFLKYYDKLILSYEVGSIKPEEQIYRSAEAFSNKPSNEHFFIDDILEYVEGAKKLGWGGTQFTTYEQLVKDLKDNDII